MNVMRSSDSNGRRATKRAYASKAGDAQELPRPGSSREESAELENKKKRLDGGPDRRFEERPGERVERRPEGRFESGRMGSGGKVRAESKLNLFKGGPMEPKRGEGDCLKLLSHIKLKQSKYNNPIIPVLPSIFAHVKHV